MRREGNAETEVIGEWMTFIALQLHPRATWRSIPPPTLRASAVDSSGLDRQTFETHILSPHETHRGESLCRVTRPWKESEQWAWSSGSADSRVVSHATPPRCSVALFNRLSVMTGTIRTIGAKRIIAITGTGAARLPLVASL